jgi:hypothetical protein
MNSSGSERNVRAGFKEKRRNDTDKNTPNARQIGHHLNVCPAIG